LLFRVICCVGAGSGLPGCRDLNKASTQDLAARIESAGDDQRREIVNALTSRGDAALPEILQAFQSTTRPVTQLVLAESVYRMPRSEQKKAALEKMRELAQDPGVREVAGRYATDPR
jgi:hypothetical protein